MVRIYTPTDPHIDEDVEPPRVCGVVQHFHTGRSRTFRDAEELQRIITEEAANRAANARPAEVEAP